jgi:gamma-glutamyltranspeptidase
MSFEGGDTQEQNAINMFLAITEFNIQPYDAVTIPRFNTNAFQGSFNPSPDRNEALPSTRTLAIREGLSESVWLRLQKMGHSLVLDQNKVNIGHPAIIYFDQKTKTGYGVTDPSTARFTGALK